MRKLAVIGFTLVLSACVSSAPSGGGGASAGTDAATETGASDTAAAEASPADVGAASADGASTAADGGAEITADSSSVADAPAAPACKATATAKNKAGDKSADLCDVALTVKSGQEFAANVKVSDAVGGGPVEALQFKVSFIHVGMGHGGSKVPGVEEVGGGLYKVTGLKPSMGGNWRMTLTAGVDAFAFDFKVN